MAYRILYTKQGTEGGWYVDVDAEDAATAAWHLAVQVTQGDPERPAVLVAIQSAQ